MKSTYKRIKITLCSSLVLLLIFGMLTACSSAESTSLPPAKQAGEEAVPEQPTADQAQGEQPTADQPPSDQPSLDQAQATQPPADQSNSKGQPGNGSLDIGFRPNPNGFGFENYGNDNGIVNLTPAEMRRMFGDKVCAATQGDSCTLIPPAQQVMEQVNGSMKNGHCEGMAVLSDVFFAGKGDPGKFGASVVKDLKLQGNEALQREIAYWYTTQFTSPAIGAKITGTPANIVDTLSKSFSNAGGSDLYTLGFYKPDKTGGHAINPYAVVDKGNGMYWIMVYDNNYPGKEMYVEVDKNANTWQYMGATMSGMEKDFYKGDATTQSLELAPLTPRMEQQVCDFCNETQSSKGRGLAAEKPKTNQIWMEGNARLLLMDEKGRKLGYEGDKFLHEIKEGSVQSILTGRVGDANPIFYMPYGMKFTAVIDGKQVDKKEPVDLVAIGPGYYIGVEEISMQANQKDQAKFDGIGKYLSYKTDADETPVLIFGIETPQYDYELEVKANDVKPGIETIIEYDAAKGMLALRSSSNEEGIYFVAFHRIDDKGVQSYESPEAGISLMPKDTIHFNLKDWAGQGKALKVLFDHGSNGEIDEEKDVEGK